MSIREDDYLISDYIKKLLVDADFLERIKTEGYINLDFNDDLEVKRVFSKKPISEKINLIKKILYNNTNYDIEVNLCGFEERYINISKIGASHIGNIVRVKAIVSAVSSLKPACEVLHLQCGRCDAEYDIIQTDPFQLKIMKKCPNRMGDSSCGAQLDIKSELSQYRDSQKLIIQEVPENVKQSPTTKEVIVFNKTLQDKFKSGDIVDIIGIVKIKPNPNPNTNRFSDTYIEAHNIIPKNKDIDINSLTDEEISKVKDLVLKYDYKTIISNVAPSIFQFDVEKEAAALALIGGVERNNADVNNRYWINVLLCGDPSVAKSQLLMATANIAPIGMYSGGRGLSAAGLTSAVIKEKNSDAPMLVVGLLPLCNKGLAAIDEFDKVESDDVKSIHGAMEQGIIPVDKGGFHTSLVAKTAVLAAANPINGRYDVNKTFGENLKGFPIPLLTRFDLIFICLDIISEEKDRKIAKRMMRNDEVTDKVDIIDRNLMKNYIFYAKGLKPIFRQDIKEYIENYYINIRRKQNREDPTPITHRQLASIIRLSEAHAKALLKNEVDKEDADAAIRLMNISLEQTCRIINVDGTTAINIDGTERVTKKADRITRITEIVKSAGIQGITVNEIYKACNGQFSESEIIGILGNSLAFYQPTDGKFVTYKK